MHLDRVSSIALRPLLENYSAAMVPSCSPLSLVALATNLLLLLNSVSRMPNLMCSIIVIVIFLYNHGVNAFLCLVGAYPDNAGILSFWKKNQLSQSCLIAAL